MLWLTVKQIYTNYLGRGRGHGRGVIGASVVLSLNILPLVTFAEPLPQQGRACVRSLGTPKLTSAAERAEGKFIHQLHPSLQHSPAVRIYNQTLKQQLASMGVKNISLQNGPERIAVWLKNLDERYGRYQNDPAVLERVKTSYLNQYVIKAEDIPENVYNSQVQRALPDFI
jgi:hypothetical protein